MEVIEISIDWNNPIVQGITASLLVALILFILKILKKSGQGIYSFFGKEKKKKVSLDLYRKSLTDQTLLISHPWMKEGQTLNDILIPVTFEVNKALQREELEVYLSRMFENNKSLRLLILGKPGSGKTIAMRVIAKTLWTLDNKIQSIPVFLTFSDIKEVTDKEGLEKKIIEKLEFYQFAGGKKDNNKVQQFVQENLYTGKLFLLFDGYDELEKSVREKAARLLNTFLGIHRQIPAAISSRTALYESELAFDPLNPCKISMAPFTPFTILKFLSLWKFEGKKSSHELFDKINGKAHLSELASNPLMLTIIAFLYSLPKYTLPDNRVEFYDKCTRALLEEWDRTKQIERANKFELHQKIDVLNRIAFEHIKNADINDELIDEDVILRNIRSEMRRLSLRVEEHSAMKNEIILNSGLLQHISATDYRFPHRTFMEFFAAYYLQKQRDFKSMLELYFQDPDKWKEVLLLYMGLNKNKDYAIAILNHLVEDFEKNQRSKVNPNFIIFSALTQCAVPDSQVADRILDLAEQFLSNRFEIEVIEELGFIAANPHWSYAQKAKDILIGLLKRELPDLVFQQVIFSLLHAGDKNLKKLIMQNLKRINLVEFFSKIGNEEKSFINRLFSLDLPKKEKEKIIDGLKEAGNFEILGYLLIENPNKDLREITAFALFQMSKLYGFSQYLDTIEMGLLDEGTKKEVDAKFEEWGWSWDFPKTENGKKVAILICLYSAYWIVKNEMKIGYDGLKQMDNRFRYLTTCFLMEKGLPFHIFNLLWNTNKKVKKYSLKKYWKNIEKYSTTIWEWFCFIIFEKPFWGNFVKLTYGIISFIGIFSLSHYYPTSTKGPIEFGIDFFVVHTFLFIFVTFSTLSLFFLIRGRNEFVLFLK